MLTVQGASWGQGWGWRTEEGCGIEDFPSQPWSTMVDLEETSKKWVLGQAGKSWWAGKAGMAQKSKIQGLGLGVQQFLLALDCRWVVGSCLGQLLVAAASQLDSVMDLEKKRNTGMEKSAGISIRFT